MIRLQERGQMMLDPKHYTNKEYPARPECVGQLDLTPPDGQQYILRMCVKAGNGIFRLPKELAWVMPMLVKAHENQQHIGINHPFCYITVRHGTILSRRDDEWHVDGFSMRTSHLPEQNYIWCDSLPTEYVDQGYDIPSTFDPLKHNINKLLEPQIDYDKVKQVLPNTVYVLDPYVLHRRPDVPPHAGIKRTFVRISFVPIQINDINNAQNPLLPQEYTEDGVLFRDNLEEWSDDI